MTTSRYDLADFLKNTTPEEFGIQTEAHKAPKKMHFFRNLFKRRPKEENEMIHVKRDTGTVNKQVLVPRIEKLPARFSEQQRTEKLIQTSPVLSKLQKSPVIDSKVEAIQSLEEEKEEEVGPIILSYNRRVSALPKDLPIRQRRMTWVERKSENDPKLSVIESNFKPSESKFEPSDFEVILAESKVKPSESKFMPSDSKFMRAESKFKPAELKFKPADPEFKPHSQFIPDNSEFIPVDSEFMPADSEFTPTEFEEPILKSKLDRLLKKKKRESMKLRESQMYTSTVHSLRKQPMTIEESIRRISINPNK